MFPEKPWISPCAITAAMRTPSEKGRNKVTQTIDIDAAVTRLAATTTARSNRCGRSHEKTKGATAPNR